MQKPFMNWGRIMKKVKINNKLIALLVTGTMVVSGSALLNRNNTDTNNIIQNNIDYAYADELETVTTKTIENVCENDIIYKTLSLSFVKKTGENTEKDGKDLSKDDEKNNPEKREENLKRDNITSYEGNEFTEDEGDLNLTGKKRKRSV